MSYNAGTYVERRIKADLEGRGFFVVRSAGSHGAVDLLAIAPGGEHRSRVLFVQVKRDAARLLHEEWNALYDVAHTFSAKPILASTEKRKCVYWLLLARKDGRQGARAPKTLVDPYGRLDGRSDGASVTDAPEGATELA